jgi:hypothetical protein
LVGGLAALALSGCREHADRAGSIRFAIDSSADAVTRKAGLGVLGLDRANLRALRDARWAPERWNALLRVTVAGQDSIPIAGRYSTTDSSVEFQPSYGFDPGRAYTVRFDPARLPTTRADSALSMGFSINGTTHDVAAAVARVLPTADSLPENLLRLYIEFSQPMSREPGTAFVHLVDDRGAEVTHAFLPLEADFWNPAHTRYTLFLDPGRVKRGILPNEQLGRALRAGHAYSLVIDSAWRDANGRPLAASYRRRFQVAPAISLPITPAEWTVAAPMAGTRDPLVVRFPRPLDHGLLRRALGVETTPGSTVPGDITIGPKETEWRFTPQSTWRAGDYSLVVLSILEDVAGNRVGRPFEVDMFERVDSTSLPERYNRRFTIK